MFKIIVEVGALNKIKKNQGRNYWSLYMCLQLTKTSKPVRYRTKTENSRAEKWTPIELPKLKFTINPLRLTSLRS